MNSIQDEYAQNEGSPPKARIQRALISCPLFSSAASTTLEAVANESTLESAASGKSLIQQASVAQSLVVIAKGRARVERSLASGETLPLGYRGASDLVGESALVGVETYAESVVAMGDCDIIRIPLAAAKQALKTDASVALAFATIVFARIGETEERLQSLFFRPVEGRVVEFLLQAMDRWGTPDARGVMISAPITHAEMALAIGSTRETVTVTLGILKRDGLLTSAGRRLIVVDRDALAKRK